MNIEIEEIEEIGKIIKKIRQNENITQNKLANAVGLKQSNISELEKRKDMLFSTFFKMMEKMNYKIYVAPKNYQIGYGYTLTKIEANSNPKKLKNEWQITEENFDPKKHKIKNLPRKLSDLMPIIQSFQKLYDEETFETKHLIIKKCTHEIMKATKGSMNPKIAMDLATKELKGL